MTTSIGYDDDIYRVWWRHLSGMMTTSIGYDDDIYKLD